MPSEAPRSELFPSLLVVDDDPDALFLFRRILAKAQVVNKIVYAEGGAAAISFLRGALSTNRLPCAVFLDIKMPAVTGFDVLRWIRQQEALKCLPVVILSTSALPRDVATAEALGATRYLTKHPTPEQLRETLQSHCPKGQVLIEPISG